MTDQPTTADYAAYRDRDRLDLLEARLSAVEARLDLPRMDGPHLPEPRGWRSARPRRGARPPTLGRLIGAVIVDDRPGGGYVGQHTYTRRSRPASPPRATPHRRGRHLGAPPWPLLSRSALRDHGTRTTATRTPRAKPAAPTPTCRSGGLVRDLLDLLDGQDPALRRSAEQHAEAEVAEAEAERVRQRDAARALALQRFSHPRGTPT